METNAGILKKDQEDHMKTGNTETGDQSSELPDDILSSILSLLTMRDAVKARVLSRRWRYVSASTFDLHLDVCTLFGINNDTYCRFSGADNFYNAKARFVKAVDQFLQLCRIPKIYSLKISYCLGNESADHIDRWISYAVGAQTEKLDVDFICPDGHERYNFPCHVFQGEASYVKHLRLQCCMLRPSPDSTDVFNSLKTLDLNDVPFDQSVFDAIVSGCTNLEQLRLHNCELPVSFSISGQVLSLKLLVLYECEGAEKIEISSVILTAFEYIGLPTNLSFVGVPSVEKVFLVFQRASESGANYMFNGLAKDLPELQILSLYLCTSQVLQIPENTTKFQQLKELELILMISSDFDLLSVIYILNASPCLQKFHLAIRRNICSKPSIMKREYPKRFYYHLKEVEISRFHFSWNALELTVHVLNHAIGLERLIINFQKTWQWSDKSKKWTYYTYQIWNWNESKRKQVEDVLSKEKRNVELIVS